MVCEFGTNTGRGIPVKATESSYRLRIMDRRTELLKCAENVARRRGYDGFSYADLANDVGIRKASIHYHFPAKADLALALIERYADTFAAALAMIDSTSDIAADRLSAYVQMYRRALSGGNKLCLCVAFAISRDSLSPETLETLDKFHSDSIDWLRQNFELAVDDGSISGVDNPAVEATALLAMVEGAQLMARAAHRVADFDLATQLFLSRLGNP